MSTPKGTEIVVICTLSAKEALIELAPEFEHESGYTVNATYGPGPELIKRIREGAYGDIFVGPENFSSALMEEGRLQAGSRTAFARSSSAVAVKAGAPKPDLSSAESFRDALLAARAVSYSAGASGIYFVKALEDLGIADAVAAKLVKPKGGELVGDVLVRGDADIGVQQVSELLPVKGIDIVGPLPDALQKVIEYGATVFAQSKEREGGRAFVEFLRSEPARKVLRHCGLDPA